MPCSENAFFLMAEYIQVSASMSFSVVTSRTFPLPLGIYNSFLMFWCKFTDNETKVSIILCLCSLLNITGSLVVSTLWNGQLWALHQGPC